jgi:predicted SAM-dependent methyltransferase
MITEFIQLSARLNNPRGLRKWINIISESFALKATEILQSGGVNRKLAEKHVNSKLVLNIGCGDALFDHCVNSDIAPTFGGLIRWLKRDQSYKNKFFINVLYKDKYLLGIADGVVFSHVLEHLPPHLAIPALENIKSFLKPGGILRISVPYLGSYDQQPVPTDQLLTAPILAKNSLIYGWGHRFMYDPELLISLLEHIGFQNIVQVSTTEGPLGETDVMRRAGETIYVVAQA